MAKFSRRPPQLGINGYQPREPFKGFHNRLERWAVMVCHRRAGKTVACVADLVISALATNKQDARFAYVAPQFNQAKDIAWLYIKRLTEDIPAMQYNESELRADFPNGARVRLYGADNESRLRGLYLDGCILDEYADMKPSVWGEIVRPMLADRKGWATFIGTPKGHNAFYRVWQEADGEWFKLMLRASQSSIVRPEELESARKGMSEDQYEQEFECSFEAAILGAFYGREMRVAEDQGRITKVDYDPEWTVHTAWDLGRTDSTCIWWYQVVAGEVRVIDYHGSAGQDVPFYARVIQSKPYKYGTHWLPHDARAKTLASSRSTIEQLGDHLGITNLRIAPQLSVQDGIQAVRLMLPRCWWDRERCEDGVEALKQYQREWDDDKKVFRDKPLHDWASDPSDAFRMLALSWAEEHKNKPMADQIRGIMVGFPSITVDELLNYDPPQARRRI